jgi:acetoin utilization deacetylase AcuC-like enzyme
LCWGAHVAGGTHHAFSDYGEGFCIFSDIAVAANVLLETYGEQSPLSAKNPLSTIRRILIIDLDVHQGNGNAALFKENDRVKTFSMHCAANYFSEKQQSDLDVELPIGCNDETYLSTLRFWLRRIENHKYDKDNSRRKFDVIFFQSGVDIHEADRLGKLSITSNGISKRNSMVFEFANRMGSSLIICMGGGYPKNDWTPIIEAHTGVYWEAHQFLSALNT